MIEKLEEIPCDKWPLLRDMYINRKDRSSCYNLLQTLINWENKEPELGLKLYSLNGNWQSNGTFIAKCGQQIFFNTCEDSLKSLQAALNCLDSAESYLLAGYQEFVAPAVENHFIHCGLEKDDYKPTYCVWYHISKDEAKLFSINCNENMQFKPLEEHHAEQINSVWPHGSAQTINFVNLLLRLNYSIGLFEGNELIAWCLILPLGSLGLLQVIETHKRRGFGSLVVRYMSKLLAEKGIEVTAPVVADNTASRSMFEKLGFKVIDKVYWTFKPQNRKA